jgi:hypothetical protein
VAGARNLVLDSTDIVRDAMLRHPTSETACKSYPLIDSATSREQSTHNARHSCFN